MQAVPTRWTDPSAASQPVAAFSAGVRAKRAVAVACALFAASSCAVDAVDQAAGGYGEIRLALSGALPDVKATTIRLYRGPLTSAGQTAKFSFPCAAYGGTKDNEPVVKDLEAANDYSVLIEGFADAACKTPVLRAYRGNIAVIAGASDTTAAKNPYWLPTVQLGKFTALAQVNPALQDTAAKKVCSTESDCRAVHANATCGSNNRCKVDHLFPLNGAARRGLPTAVALDDGRVALIGGLGVQDNGYWKAAAEQVEVFDPKGATFQSRLVGNAGAAVGLAQAVTVTGGAFAYSGGSASVKVALVPGKLSAAIDTRECSGAASAGCAVSDKLGRWTVSDAATGSTAQQFALGLPLAFPMIARVQTPQGERMLVAGGSEVPLNANFDKRRTKTQLCKVDASNVDCPEQTGANMKSSRAMAAIACVARDATGGCTKLLLVGGRKSAASALSETYDAASNSFTAATDVGAVPKDLHGGTLYPVGDKAWLLVGATAKKIFMEDGEVATGGDLAPMRVTVDVPADASKPAVVTWAAVDLGAFAAPDNGKRLLPASVQLADGSVLVIGGLDEGLKVAADALWIGADGKARGRLALNLARFGAAAARIGGKGPFGGCALLAGGFSVNAAGALEPQNQVELFCPAQ